MLTPNPGFVLVAASLFVLGSPKSLRAPTIAGSALLALWLLLDRQFGAGAAMAQMGLPVVPFILDARNQLFGIAMLIATVLIALYSAGRRNRFEDSCILLLAGGAVSALFVGDLVSFVAAVELAGLGAAGVVFASGAPRANAAGVRMLVWFGLEGLMFLIGVALHLAAQADTSIFESLDITKASDAFIFIALMIRVGAPLAHVWFKDAVRHASPTGGVALSALTTSVGVYALARLFPAEPILVFVGAAMVGLGLLYALAEDDLRAAGAAAMSAIVGECIMLVGVGSPIALVASGAQMFAATFVFIALQMALGAIVERQGAARLSAFGGLYKAMPVSTGLLVLCGLAAAAAPGTALFATLSIVLDGLARWETRWPWLAVLTISPALFIGFTLRPALAIYQAASTPRKRDEASFPMLLGTAVAVFFCISIGLAPGWLFTFMPSEMIVQPWDRVGPHLEILGAAGLAYSLLWVLRLVPKERPVVLVDLDGFYRGPLALISRGLGIATLRLQGVGERIFSDAWGLAVRLGGRLAGEFDRPTRAGRSAWAQFALISLIVLVVLLAQHPRAL